MIALTDMLSVDSRKGIKEKEEYVITDMPNEPPIDVFQHICRRIRKNFWPMLSIFILLIDYYKNVNKKKSIS